MLLSVSMKMDTTVWCGWTTQPCAQKLNTAWQVQVAGSTVFGCGGGPFQLGFGYFGGPIWIGLMNSESKLNQIGSSVKINQAQLTFLFFLLDLAWPKAFWPKGVVDFSFFFFSFCFFLFCRSGPFSLCFPSIFQFFSFLLRVSSLDVPSLPSSLLTPFLLLSARSSSVFFHF